MTWISGRSVFAVFITAIMIVILAGVPAHAQKTTNVTTVVFVRHAEKDSLPADDPHLTVQGRERAKALALTLGKAGVTSIVATQYNRTKETAAPLAEALGIAPAVIPVVKDAANPGVITPGSYDAVMNHIRRNAGGTILIVGHSNTVPVMMKKLGCSGDYTIPEDAFDRMFIVVVKGSDVIKAATIRYGVMK